MIFVLFISNRYFLKTLTKNEKEMELARRRPLKKRTESSPIRFDVKLDDSVINSPKRTKRDHGAVISENLDLSSVNWGSQGPKSPGVTWDFSSPSPSQYKRFTQKSFARREEESKRIADQMKTDGIKSKFLGTKCFDRKKDVGDSERISIAELARLSKKSHFEPVLAASVVSIDEQRASIFEEVQKLCSELQAEKRSRLETNRVASLDAGRASPNLPLLLPQRLDLDGELDSEDENNNEDETLEANRSFPRPEKSVSPEFPESPSDDNYRESTTIANDWSESDLDDSLFLKTATQAEQAFMVEQNKVDSPITPAALGSSSVKKRLSLGTPRSVRRVVVDLTRDEGGAGGEDAGDAVKESSKHQSAVDGIALRVFADVTEDREKPVKQTGAIEHLNSSSILMSDFDDDVDLSVIEAASQEMSKSGAASRAESNAASRFSSNSALHGSRSMTSKSLSFGSATTSLKSREADFGVGKMFEKPSGGLRTMEDSISGRKLVPDKIGASSRQGKTEYSSGMAGWSDDDIDDETLATLIEEIESPGKSEAVFTSLASASGGPTANLPLSKKSLPHSSSFPQSFSSNVSAHSGASNCFKPKYNPIVRWGSKSKSSNFGRAYKPVASLGASTVGASSVFKRHQSATQLSSPKLNPSVPNRSKTPEPMKNDSFFDDDDLDGIDDDGELVNLFKKADEICEAFNATQRSQSSLK